MNNSLVKQQDNIQNTVGQIGAVNNPTTSALTAKSLAEVQGKVFMAKQFPREMDRVMAKLQSSCERKSLAEVAEYEFPRGGTKITGASIKLLETVAQCYGNIHYTWKEISRDNINHKSTCIADAWDLENNVSSSLEFEVAHFRDKRSGNELVTGERDLYELIASNAARRVRKCLENVIPRDIVDQAREWCDETLSTKVDIQGGIDKAIHYFKEHYKISLKSIEKYFGMSRQGFTKNTYISLKKLFTSFNDGLANPNEVFPDDTLVDASQKGVANTLTPQEEKETKTGPKAKKKLENSDEVLKEYKSQKAKAEVEETFEQGSLLEPNKKYNGEF